MSGSPEIGSFWRRTTPTGRGLVVEITGEPTADGWYLVRSWWSGQDGALGVREHSESRLLASALRAYERFEPRKVPTGESIEVGSVWRSKAGVYSFHGQVKVTRTGVDRVYFAVLAEGGRLAGSGSTSPGDFLFRYEPKPKPPKGSVRVCMKDGTQYVLELPMTREGFDEMLKTIDSDLFSSWVTFETTGPRVSVRVSDIERFELHWEEL